NVIAFSPTLSNALCAQSFQQNPQNPKLGKDHSISVIGIFSGREERRLIGNTQPIMQTIFSRDGSLIVSAGQDGTVRLWESTTGLLIKTLQVKNPVSNFFDYPTNRVYEEGVSAISLSNDNNYLIETHDNYSEERVINSLWDVASGRNLKNLPKSVGSPFVFLDADNRIFAHLLKPSLPIRLDLDNGGYRPLSVSQPSLLPMGFSANNMNLFFASDMPGTFRLDLDTASFSRFLPDNMVFVSGNGQRGISFADGRSKGGAGGSVEVTRNVYGSSWDDKYNLAIWDLDRGVREGLFTIKTGRTQRSGANGPPIPVQLRMQSISFDGSKLTTSNDDRTISVWDSTTGRETQISHPFWHKQSNIQGFVTGCIWNNNSTLATIEVSGDTAGMIRLWDSASGNEKGRSSITVHPPIRMDLRTILCRDITISPDGDKVVIIEDSSIIEPPEYDATLSFGDIGNLKFILKRNISGIHIRGAEGWKREVLWPGLSRDFFVVGNIMDHRVVAKIDPNTGISRRFAVKEGGGIAISHTGEKIFAGDSLWDEKTQKPLATLAVFGNEPDWLLLTPEGYYSSSENGHRYVNMRRGNEVYSAEQLYDVFYRPDLVIRKLRGEDISNDGKLLTIDEALANPPPVAEILSINARGNEGAQEVSYRIDGKGGGIGEVRVFHNRKLIHRADAKLTGTAHFEGNTVVQGVAGENEVTVLAKNQQNSVQGIMRNRSFTVAGTGKKPRAYVLAVGIGQYLSHKDALPFAVSDARRIAAALQEGLGSLYPVEDVQVELVADDQATREGILKQFKRLADVVQPGDQFVMFFASHGLLWNGQYFVVTHDFDGAFGPGKGISSDELMEASREIKALHQWLIFDTCHAGGLDQTVTATYDARMSVLARQMGLHVFAAASPLEKAVEGYQGSGVFTHALLEGLSQGAPVDLNHDQVVTVTELGEYVKHRTEEIMKTIGYRQTPRILDVGQDTRLYRVATAPEAARPTQLPVQLPAMQPPKENVEQPIAANTTQSPPPSSSVSYEKIAQQTAKSYVDKMLARCGDSSFIKQGNSTWELIGDVNVVCCHESPELPKNDPQGITWRAATEVYGSKSREYMTNMGWSKWGDDSPLLVGVYMQNGQWKSEELKSVSCSDIQTVPSSVSGHSKWLFPDSKSRYLTETDLRGLSLDQLWVARNEIFARNGFIFKTDKGRDYVRSLGSAYSPITENPIFNPVEK
ncbi:MAG: caspase family protein, partial [Syntrophales bacterium LBB04]|nr:caspase family protein [Syntrophales bacterium LBB04]